GVGSHHEVLAPEKNREHSIKLQLPAGNVGFMRRLLLFGMMPSLQISGACFPARPCVIGSYTGVLNLQNR
ncbi:hypothetical protein, partial [Pseudomonas syringae]